MCAIFGCALDKATSYQKQLLEAIGRESQIRGKHSTGISYIRFGVIRTVIKTVPSNLFFDEVIEWKSPDNLRLIGHCRYPTSALRFNQPLHSPELSMVHNGVISQLPKERWFDEFGLQTETSNDSELILRAVEQGLDPIKYFPDASIAMATLTKEGDIHVQRNGKRPCHFHPVENGFFFFSTKSIGVRAGVPEEDIIKVKSYGKEHIEYN